MHNDKIVAIHQYLLADQNKFEKNKNKKKQFLFERWLNKNMNWRPDPKLFVRHLRKEQVCPNLYL